MIKYYLNQNIFPCTFKISVQTTFYHYSLAVYLFLNYAKEYWLLTLPVLRRAAEPSR